MGSDILPFLTFIVIGFGNAGHILIAPLVGVRADRIMILWQRTKRGSCAGNGNLNFNCLFMCLPDEVIDSIVVHELCHCKHTDRSAAFCAEVYRVFPEYRRYNTYIKEHGSGITARARRATVTG